MIPLAISMVVSFLAALLLALVVWQSDSTRPLNRIYTLYCLSIALLAFTSFQGLTAESPSRALFWYHAQATWPLTFCLLIHFVFHFSGLLSGGRRWVFYGLVYGIIPYYIACYIAGEMTIHSHLTFMGYAFHMDEGRPAITVLGLWMGVLSLGAFIVSVVAYARSKDPNQKKQYFYFSLGAFTTLVAGFISHSYLPRRGIVAPDFTYLGNIISSSFLAWGIKKYELFNLTPERAAKNILSTMTDGLFLVNKNGVVDKINPGASTLLRRDSVEIVGQRFEDICPESAARPSSEKLHSDSAQKSESFEARLVISDDETCPVLVSHAIIHDHFGQVAGAVYIAHDINERKMVEQELIEAKLAADRANEIKSAFLANMSHEIRTPMNAVLGMTEILLNTNLNKKQHGFATTVQKSAELLLKIIDDLLDFSKIEAGKIDLEIIDFDLRNLLEDIGDLLVFRAQEKNLEYVTFVDPTVPSRVRGDPGRIRQILINLAGNAIKFTDEGEVVVRVELDKLDGDDLTLHFSVQDTGIGIPEDQQAKLFDAFAQADASTTRKYGGTGLGLSISKRLTELMGGEIGFASDPSKGSTFWFTVALQKQKRLSRPSFINESLKGQRILVVDDNSTNRHWLNVLLESWDCYCETAPDAGMALSYLKEAVDIEKPFDIVIIDMHMPQINGEALGEMIKELPLFEDTALVMMTSMGTRGDVKRLEAIGFAAYLTKPVKQSVLYDCLATLVFRRKRPKTEPAPPIVTRFSLMDAKRTERSILVAEDNEVNQEVALAFLSDMGFDVHMVGTGAEAIKALEAAAYDLVLMDCQMPEMDGYEACRTIRDSNSNVLNRDVPIIAMTAHSLPSDKKRCLDAGMNDYISKPIKREVLSQTLNKWLNKSPETEQGEAN